jgi:hypothetical protein
MQKRVVEYAGVPVGIVIPFGDSLQFMAVKFHVMGLDGQRFRSLQDVRRAIGAHLSRGGLAAA